MANRSYLYALDLEPQAVKDLSENAYAVPITHMLLVSDATERVDSMLWDCEHPIAIRGRSEGGYRRCVALLELLRAQPDLPDREAIEPQLAAALEFLARPENSRGYYHLEAGEIFGLGDLPLDTSTRHLLDTIGALAAEVDALVAARSQAVLRDAKTWELRECATQWPMLLGLFFSDVLYFHFER